MYYTYPKKINFSKKEIFTQNIFTQQKNKFYNQPKKN